MNGQEESGNNGNNRERIEKEHPCESKLRVLFTSGMHFSVLPIGASVFMLCDIHTLSLSLSISTPTLTHCSLCLARVNFFPFFFSPTMPSSIQEQTIACTPCVFFIFVAFLFFCSQASKTKHINCFGEPERTSDIKLFSLSLSCLSLFSLLKLPDAARRWWEPHRTGVGVGGGLSSEHELGAFKAQESTRWSYQSICTLHASERSRSDE